MEHATILRITTLVIALINLRDKIVEVSLTKIEITGTEISRSLI